MNHFAATNDQRQRDGARRRPSRRRPAFTLLEVVIAAMLIAVLMGAVYQALFIYRMLFERGETRTEEIQLVRTLTQQFSDDLGGAIQDPVSSTPRSRDASGARRFGLFGNSTELRIDVLQIPAFEIAPTPTAEEMEDSTEPHKLQAPELRTIYYSYFDSTSLDSTLPDARVGLTRRELDFETPEQLDDADLTGFAEVPVLGSEPAEEVPVAPSGSTFDQLLEVGMDSSVTWAPEVVSLKFRYFDGTRWRKSWDSLSRKGLPVAVEMTLAVASLDDADAMRGVTEETFDESTPVLNDLVMVTETTEDEELGLEGEELALEGEDAPEEPGLDLTSQRNLPPVHVHRLVVFLPNSPLIKERKPVQRQAAPALEQPVLTSPAPLAKAVLQPARSKRGTRRGAPDQWMRNK